MARELIDEAKAELITILIKYHWNAELIHTAVDLNMLDYARLKDSTEKKKGTMTHFQRLYSGNEKS